MRLSLVLLLAGRVFAASVPMTLTVSQESAPAGGTVHIKLYSSVPQVVASGEVSLGLDPAFFGTPAAIVPVAAAGLASGYAVLARGLLDIHFFNVGGISGLPMLAVTVQVLPAVRDGASSVVSADASGSAWLDPAGNQYAVTVAPGKVSAGGSLSVTGVTPSGGLLPAGTVLRIAGQGFDGATRVEIPAVPIAGMSEVSPQQLDVTLAGPADLGGKQITVRNGDGSAVQFFGAVAAPELAAYRNAIPLLPTAAFQDGSAYISKDGFDLEVLANPGTSTVQATVSLGLAGDNEPFSKQIAIAPGIYTESDFGGAYAEKFAISADGPLQMVSLQNQPQVAGPYISSAIAMSPTGPPVTGSMLNGASATQASIAPGELVTLHGLYPDNGPGRSPAQVLIDGRPISQVYSSTTQINAVVPADFAPEPTATVQVTVDGNSTVWSVPVVAAAPGIFTADSSGGGQAVAIDADGSVNGPAQAAAPGAAIQIYATGIPLDAAAITLTIGGTQAEITSVSAFAPGVVQIDAIVPDGISAGAAVPVVLSCGTAHSAGGVTLAVE